MSETKTDTPVQTQDTQQPTTPVGDSPAAQAGQQVFDWSKLLVAGATALTGLLATPYGIYIGLAAAVLGGIAFLFLRSMWKNYQFESAKTQAGSKVGQEASQDQQKINDNRDAVDDFLGRNRRS